MRSVINLNDTYQQLLEGYSAFRLTNASQKLLRRHFPPKYEVSRGEHITYDIGAKPTDSLPSKPRKVEIFGYADSGNGVEAAVARVDGTHRRPSDRGIYHVTLSHGKDRKPAESNELLSRGFRKLKKPIRIEVEPKYYK